MSVFLDGRLVERQAFATATTWHPQVPRARTTAGDRSCKLKVVSDGLLGTTRFAFDR